jgi:DNA (cytosine-5)-methyltransferase 1
MKFLSVCSGIEAASVAWHPLGWESVAYSEIEPFPCKVLQHHYPDVLNLGDMTKFKEWPDADVDVFVGGTPCQSFSVAGLRKGLDDPRGNLMLTYLAIAKRYRPNWLVWENVPGVLSSAGGRDFGSLLGGLAVLGYGFAYRVLDAQYFGVAQRRKRVFVVGYLGDWRPAAAVLFERHSLQGHPAPSRKAREGAAGTIKASVGTGGVDVEHPMVAVLHSEISPALKARDHKGPSSDGDGDGAILVPMQPIAYNISPSKGALKDVIHVTDAHATKTLDASASNPEMHQGGTAILQPIALAENTIGRKPENGGNGDGFTDGGPMYTLNATGVHGVAQPLPFGVSEKPDVGDCLRSGASKADKHESTTYVAQPVATHDVARTMLSRNTSGGFSNSIDHAAAGYMALQAMAVRRLTPVEWERLQGFGDNYTDIQPKGKPTPDGPRYKALGNSMAVPVMAWIGKRIQEVDAICKTQQNK